MGSIFKTVFLHKMSDGMSSSSNDTLKEPVLSTPRHRGKGWTGVNRLSQNLVAKSHQVDPNEVSELEDLKGKESGIVVLSSPVKIRKIIKVFNLQNLDQNHPKTLGNTGIVIFFNPNLNNYCLKK